ncbi:hypothetical protein T484DRAFT_1786107, partial [Baffinella frigidus]
MGRRRWAGAASAGIALACIAAATVVHFSRHQGASELVERDRFGIPDDDAVGGANHQTTLATLHLVNARSRRQGILKLAAVPAKAAPAVDSTMMKMVGELESKVDELRALQPGASHPLQLAAVPTKTAPAVDSSMMKMVGELEGKVDELSGEVRSLKQGSSEQESARDSAMERLVKKAAADEVAKQALTFEQGPNHYDPNCPCRGGCPCPAHGGGGEGARTEYAAPAMVARAPVPARAAPEQAALQEPPRVAPVVAGVPGGVPIAQLKALRLEVDTTITAEEAATEKAAAPVAPVAPQPAPSATAAAAPAVSAMAASGPAVHASSSTSSGGKQPAEVVAQGGGAGVGGIPGGLRALVEEEVQREVKAAVVAEEEEKPAEEAEAAVQPSVSEEDAVIERAPQDGGDSGEASGAAAAQATAPPTHTDLTAAADALRSAVKTTEMRQWAHLENKVDGRAMMTARAPPRSGDSDRRGAREGG